MLETFFEAPFTLKRLRLGPSGRFIDGFAQYLKGKGYSWWTSRRYLRCGAHLGRFLETEARDLRTVDEAILKAFRQHFPRCECPLANGGTTKDSALGARVFVEYLSGIGVATQAAERAGETTSRLLSHPFAAGSSSTRTPPNRLSISIAEVLPSSSLGWGMILPSMSRRVSAPSFSTRHVDQGPVRPRLSFRVYGRFCATWPLSRGAESGSTRRSPPWLVGGLPPCPRVSLSPKLTTSLKRATPRLQWGLATARSFSFSLGSGSAQGMLQDSASATLIGPTGVLWSRGRGDTRSGCHSLKRSAMPYCATWNPGRMSKRTESSCAVSLPLVHCAPHRSPRSSLERCDVPVCPLPALGLTSSDIPRRRTCCVKEPLSTKWGLCCATVPVT